jgi:chemotaxis protein methyltransferase CheR
MQTNQIEAVASHIYRKFGIFVGKNNYERLEMRLSNMVMRGFCENAEDLCSRLAAEDSACLGQLACCITTCHTFFFRESAHFQTILADIRRHQGKTVHIWCAACSTGEEPYSIAMTLLDAGITDFHIVASDVNRNVLADFNRGIYHENKLIQTPRTVRDRYFISEGGGYYRIIPQLRQYISIKNINLMDTVHFNDPFDYVLCRNVFIYFDEKSRMRAIQNITNNLRKGGMFFIGLAETLLFKPENLQKTGTSVYCRTN